MNSIKIIFVDIDGTLVYRDEKKGDQIAEKNKEIIQLVKEKGIRVIVTTGRASCLALPVMKELQLEDEYLISYNGGMITKKEEIIIKNCLSNEFIQEMNEMIQKYNLYSQYYQGEECYIDERTEYTKKYEDIAKFYPIVIGKKLFEMKDLQRITIVTENKEMIEMIESIVKRTDNVEMYIFWDHWIEITSKSATKGNAVNQVCKILEIDPKNAMAIGDDKIDVSMWNVVGYPVVMGQAKEQYKTDRIVTDTCENAGVAKVIEKYCL